MIRKFFTIIGTIGIFVGGVVLIAIMGAARPKPERQTPEITPPTVFFSTVEPQLVTLKVNAQGEVRPQTDITLTSQVSGKIVRTSDLFVDGGAFEKGDLLIKIEDADFRAAVASAKARVAQAEETLRREEAESELARQDYEDLGRDVEANPLTLREPQLAQARANFEATKADLQSAYLNLERTSIKAPFDGRVRTRNVGVGQFVTPGAQLGQLFSTDIAEINLALTDGNLTALGLPIAFTETEERPGPPVTLSAVVAGTLHAWEGRIARTSGAIDPTTRQVSAIAVVDDPYGAGSDNGTPLAMGLFVNAEIAGKPYADAIILPRTAIYGRDQVYVIKDDDTVESRTVTVVASDRDTVTIASGVNAGERVVTSPLRGASDGDKVLPTDPDDLSKIPSEKPEDAVLDDKRRAPNISSNSSEG